MSKLLGTLIAFFLVFNVSSVLAQSNVTVETLEPGQVVIKNESDGTIYLTNEIIESTGSASETAPIPTRNNQIRSPLSNMNIELPEGFAASFSGLFNGVLSFVLVIAALLVFFFLIWGAFDWITSGGDKGKTDKAREKITAAVIGLIIIASSYAILTLALRFLGFANINEVFDSAGTIQGVPAVTPSPNTLETLNASPTPTLK